MPSGRTAVFTCVVKLGRKTIWCTTEEDVKWDDNMGNAIISVSRDPYMVNSNFENVGQDQHH